MAQTTIDGISFWSFLGPYWVHGGSSECQSEYFLIFNFKIKFSKKQLFTKNKKVSGSFRRVFGLGVALAVSGVAELVF